MRALNRLCSGMVAVLLLPLAATAVIRDGGIDPANLGKGDWIYYMSMATNKLGGNVPWVTNEASLMGFYKAVGVRYIMVKSATSDKLFNGSYSFPQFTKQLVDTAHAYGILIFGYNRSYGENIPGEVQMADFVFQQGGDGFVFDAEGEWESSNDWIGDQGPALAWDLCSQVRSNWPNKFLAHAPFPIISYHASFPYKEFGYWCDAVMPQVYPQGWTKIFSRPSAGMNWCDLNFANWQNSLAALPPTNVNGIEVWWTNSIKPLAPVNHVYGPKPPNSGVTHIDDDFVTEFVDYVCADPYAVTAGGYQGANFWRADLHGIVQWTNIARTTVGSFAGIVNNVVIDNPTAVAVGDAWAPVQVFWNGKFQGNGSGSDTNSFGTDYLVAPKGAGSNYVEFRPLILTAGEYSVHQWHPSLANASAGVPHVIQFAGGTATVAANQRTNAGRWSYLGTFPFAAGTNGTIRVLDSVPEAGAVAIADGIKLIFVPPAAPPAAPRSLAATVVNSFQVNLAWVDASTNEAGFLVLRSETSGGPYMSIALLPPNARVFSDTTVLDNRKYYYVVKASNAAGESPVSNEVQAVTPAFIPEPPSIIDPPQALGVPEGAPARFRVTAAGTPPLSYQWLFGSVPMDGETSSTLLIPAAGQASLGTYSVIVTNRYGMITSSPAPLVIVEVGIYGDNSLGEADVPADATRLVSVSAGGWHFVGLREDGSLCAWGANWDGQCNVPLGLGRVLATAAGGYHSLAILEDLSVRAWGANESHQCRVPADLGDVIAICGGTWHSVAARMDGTVVAWGDNTWGQAAVPVGLRGAAAVAAGAAHTLALKSDGSVVAWGANYDGQGSYVGQANVPAGLRAKAIAAGDYHSVALLTNGTVVAWGANSRGQCVVPVAATNIIGIAAGGAHTAALRRDGAVLAWGDNSSGQCTLWQGTSAPVGIAAGGASSAILWPDGEPSLRLWAPRVRSSCFSAVAQSQWGRSYAFEANDSLNTQNWTNLSVLEGNGGLLLLNQTNLNSSTRFYRFNYR